MTNDLTNECRDEFEKWVESSDHGTMTVSEWMWLAWAAAWGLSSEYSEKKAE